MTRSDTRKVTVADGRGKGAFVHGGVLFDVGGGFVLPDDLSSFCTPPRGRAVARIDCRVSHRPELDGSREVNARWVDARAEVTAGPMRAALRELSLGNYEADAEIAPTSLGAHALLGGLSAIVLERTGGFVIHAAGLELDGGVWLFVGPSGAGKSTAVRLSRGGRAFCADRASIVLGTDGPWAWALPGGHRAIGAIASEAIDLPLRGVLRVRHAASETRVSRAGGADALRILRESTFRSSDGEPAHEAALLDDLTTLADRTFVGFADIALTDDPTGALRGAGRGGVR